MGFGGLINSKFYAEASTEPKRSMSRFLKARLYFYMRFILICFFGRGMVWATWWCQGPICDVGNWTRVDYVQDKVLNPSTISLVPWVTHFSSPQPTLPFFPTGLVAPTIVLVQPVWWINERTRGCSIAWALWCLELFWLPHWSSGVLNNYIWLCLGPF